MMNNIYCKHYLLPNRSLLNNNDFKLFISNLKYPHYFDKDHICLNIKDSIHYKILSKELPFELYDKYITITNQPEHSVEKYKNLINNFNINKLESIKMQKFNDKYIIIDGCHRLAILSYLNNNNIEQYLSYIS